jgi:hypothetical protein
MVSYGQSSGAIPPLDVVTLSVKGSLYLTRPTLGTFTAMRANLLSMADDLFDAVESGSVRIAVNQTYALRDVAQAHRDLEARKDHGLDGAVAVGMALYLELVKDVFKLAAVVRRPVPRRERAGATSPARLGGARRATSRCGSCSRSSPRPWRSRSART